jgi:hypothetical protein
MIDWFVLLMPFAALPIVLLFVFVGCGLDRSGIPSNIFFLLPEDYDYALAAVDLIEATITVTGAGGDSQSAIVTMKKGGFSWTNEVGIDLAAIDAEEEGSAHCECKIKFFNSDTLESVVPPADHVEPDRPFQLTVTAPGVGIEEFHLS